MSKFYKKVTLISLILVTFLLIFDNSHIVTNFNIGNKDLNKVYKVAFYNHPPYYYLNDNSTPGGYYHELMELMSKRLNIKYEYVYLNIKDCIDMLMKNELDIVFGVSKSSAKDRDILYSSLPIGKEDVSVYTHSKIEHENLYELEGLKFGYIKHESNNDLFKKILLDKKINVNYIEYSSFDKLKKAFINNDVDSIIHLSSDLDLKNYNKIYNFSLGQLFLATSKESGNLIKYIDTYLYHSIDNSGDKSVHNIYTKYFLNNVYRKNRIFLLSIIFFISSIGFICFFVYDYIHEIIKSFKLKNKLLSDFEDNNFTLYYQPIVNPNSKTIKGFEGLLRLNKDGNILSPHFFLKDIEKSNLTGYTAKWILERAINDYNIIKSNNKFIYNNFYISINLSFKEIEDNVFIDFICNLLEESSLKENSICLEIVEKFPAKDLQSIQLAINKLKNAGFLVAIDDFGVEYSNLDILEKIDCDIIKLDKYFIDDIETSFIRKEVVYFISKVCNYTNKIVVCEGVETQEQENVIKNFNNERFYIQGYYYSKPLDIDTIIKFKF